MDHTDENARQQKPNQQKIDRWLDAALEHYSEDGPRAGLEARVLATLEADRREREQRGVRWSWRLVLAAGVAAVLIIVIARAPWHSTQRTISTPVETAKTEGPGPAVSPRTQAPLVAGAALNFAGSRRSTRRDTQLLKQASEAPPRLAQFPAPRPLSDQERLLVVLADNSSPEQLAQDADVQQRVRQQVEEAPVSGGGTLEPRGK